MCLILNGYRYRAVWISRPKSIKYLSVRLDEEQILQKVDMWDQLLTRILDAAACHVKLSSDKQHVTVAHKLQSSFSHHIYFYHTLLWKTTPPSIYYSYMPTSRSDATRSKEYR